MKFILFNINDTNKNVINKIWFDETSYINEVSFSKDILESMVKDQKGFMTKIKYKLKDKFIEKVILNALGNHDKKWHYILSKNMPENKYLCNKAESLLGYKVTYAHEMDNNIFKYIDEYLIVNNSLKKHELKVLLVVTSNKDLNFTLLNNLIREYKCVNIYLNEKPSSYILKRIKEINKEEGTTIEIVKKERKAFTEYNVIYFADDKKANYPRFRFNKNALVMDIELAYEDKFNSNITFINEYISRKDVLSENVVNLMNTYNGLQLAGVVRKIVNELDKS